MNIRLSFPILTLLASVAVARAGSSFALGFDGSDLATIPDSAIFHQIEATDKLTVEAWVNIASYPQNWFPIVDKYKAAGDFGWTFQIFGGVPGSPSNLQFVGGIGPTVLTPWTPTLNRWTHVALSYDRSQGVARFYVDGSLLGAPAYSADIQPTNTDPLYVGYGPSGGNEFAAGGIDELRIWDRALTDSEIAANYKRTLAGTEAGLVGYWQLEEGLGNAFRDVTANANHGTLGTGAARPTWLAPGAPIPEPSTALFGAAVTAFLGLARSRPSRR